MREIGEIQAFTKELEIVHLPQSRIIGRGVQNGGKLGNTAPQLWDKVYATEDHRILEAMPKQSGSDLFGWTREYDPETKTFLYMVCALTRPETPVPEGFLFREIPETLCAVGRFGESVNQTLKRAEKLGYGSNWNAPGCGWNAELYFSAEEENPPRKNCKPWHWLVPVCPL